MHGSFRIADANDHTGTGPLRRHFIAASDKRWKQAVKLVGEAVEQGDILGLGSQNLASIGLMSGHRAGHADRITAFGHWLSTVLRHVVYGNDGSWMWPFIEEAQKLAASRVAKMGASTTSSLSPAPRHWHSLAASELQGLVASQVTQASRAIATDLAGNASSARPAMIARDIKYVLLSGMHRSQLMTDYLVSKAFTAATVEHFRAAGIGRVGIVPERYGVKVGGQVRERIRDRKTRVTRRVKMDVVQWLTAGDDDVCLACEDASEDGPYSLDDVLDLIPLHPNCRCSVIPADDARFSQSDLV